MKKLHFPIKLFRFRWKGWGLLGTLSFFSLFFLPLSLSVKVQASIACQEELSGCDLVTDDRCAERFYACGRYETLLHTLWAEDFAPTITQKYLIGASLYGLFTRTRSQSLKCEYLLAAKGNLEDFLLEKDLQFRERGHFGTIGHMNQIYHATKMVGDLNASAGTGCVESALTITRVERMAKTYAIKEIKSVFLTPNEKTQEDLDSIILAIRSFVSKASDLETGLALRRIELQTGERYLLGIKSLFEEIFGKVQISQTHDVIIGREHLMSLERKAADYLAQVNLQQYEFKKALGGVSPEEYSQRRLDNIKDTYSLLRISAFHLNMGPEILSSDSQRPLKQLWSAVYAEDASQIMKESLKEIKKSWNNYGQETGICRRGGGRKWYCQQ